MGELTKFTCINPDCDIVYSVDPGDCVCGAMSFVRVGDEVPPAPSASRASTRTTAPVEVLSCTREDCGQPVPAGARSCPYCGTELDLPPSSDRIDTTPTTARPERRGQPALVVADGTRITLREGEDVVLGRSPEESPWARLFEGHPGVSRRHASICVSRGRLHVRDIKSSNGTWVNGIRIQGAAELPVTDGIRVGLGQRFELEVRKS